MPQFIKPKTDLINDFLKSINVVYLFQKVRFITNINEEISLYLKDLCKIPTEEKILMVLDDSYFKNLKQVVVFTDEKIYWTIKNATMTIKQDNTEINTKGQSLVNNKLLKKVSIFSKMENDVKYIFVISEQIQLIIPFNHFQIESSLTLSFYSYISNYCGGYEPDNAKNESIYKKMSKTKIISKINIFARLFNTLSYFAALFLIVNVVLQYYSNSILESGKIICILMVLKLLAIIFGYKKSKYSNLLLLILTYNILSFQGAAYYFNINLMYIIYAGIIILFGTFNFDKVFKYFAFVLAIITIGHMMTEYFNIEMILRYFQ